MNRSTIISFVLVVVLLSLAAVSPAAAAFPEREITIVVPWAAGGGTDRLARFFADKYEQELGVPVVVSNRTGGDGAVGHTAAATASPDGYTIGNVTMELSTIGWLGLTGISHEDFAPLIQFNEDYAAVIVKADAPFDTVVELLDAIADDPDAFMFSGSGAGSVWDLARVGMLNAYGIDPQSVVWIPSQGAAPAITDLLGGHIDVITISYPEAAAQIEAGEFKALALMAPERDPRFPDVPTLMEYDIDWSAGTWRGFALPKDTPAEIIDVLYQAARAVVDSEEFIQFMDTNDFGLSLRGPEEFAQFLEEDYWRWEEVLRVGGYID